MHKFFISQKIKPMGPYSSAVIAGNTLFLAGQGTFDQETGEKYLGDFKKQVTIALSNTKTIIEEAGFSISDVTKVTVYLTDLTNTPVLNEVYKTYFSEGNYPARTTIGVKELPTGMSVEIEAIAVKSS